MKDVTRFKTGLACTLFGGDLLPDTGAGDLVGRHRFIGGLGLARLCIAAGLGNLCRNDYPCRYSSAEKEAECLSYARY